MYTAHLCSVHQNTLRGCCSSQTGDPAVQPSSKTVFKCCSFALCLQLRLMERMRINPWKIWMKLYKSRCALQRHERAEADLRQLFISDCHIQFISLSLRAVRVSRGLLDRFCRLNSDPFTSSSFQCFSAAVT